MSNGPDLEYAMIDGAIVSGHQKATGAKSLSVIAGNHLPVRGPKQAIGRSRGGLTTKIVALVDALGNLVKFLLLPGRSTI
ncbi:hypothetical protein JI58_00980 [Marinosulfonomonas sp. PRT-SC04]|nr:hypothetical protein JI58_00980 [Marinosulfonomonas sp. PRT-SC04]